MNAIVKNIPNSVTCLNLLSGVMAIICAAKADAPLWGLSGFGWAYVFVGIAAVADFLDGFMARLLRAYSDMGKELDSLCDCVSFGVAPALLLFYTLRTLGAQEWLQYTSLLIAAAGALRLAKFNVDTRQTTSFIGLPIPANAIFWIGYTALALQGTQYMASPWLLLPVLLVECWLMVSELRLFSLKFKTWGWKGNEFRWLLIITAPVLLLCLGLPGLMWLIVAYILYGLVSKS